MTPQVPCSVETRGSWLQAREPREAQAAMPPLDQLHNREIEVGSVPAWLLKSAGPQCT